MEGLEVRLAEEGALLTFFCQKRGHSGGNGED